MNKCSKGEERFMKSIPFIECYSKLDFSRYDDIWGKKVDTFPHEFLNEKRGKNINHNKNYDFKEPIQTKFLLGEGIKRTSAGLSIKNKIMSLFWWHFQLKILWIFKHDLQST